MVLDERARPGVFGRRPTTGRRSFPTSPPGTRAESASVSDRFQFNDNTPAGADRYANFEHGLVRGAEDLEPTRYYGKGAARCFEEGDAIIVWSMGRE